MQIQLTSEITWPYSTTSVISGLFYPLASVISGLFYTSYFFNISLQSNARIMSRRFLRLVISRVATYFHEPEASANTAYE